MALVQPSKDKALGGKGEARMEKSQDPKIDDQDQKKEGSSPEGAEVKLVELEAQAKEAQDKYLRVAADLENVRRRHDKEKRDLAKFATEGLLRDLLPVLDSFDQALSVEVDASAQSFRTGVELVKKGLIEVLQKHGLEPIEALGQEFNPEYHQAVAKAVSSEVLVDTVAVEMAKGYLLNGRLLRPSMVSVTQPGEPS